MREKLKKLQLKGFVAGILVMTLLMPIVAVANTTITRQITYGVSVVLNGQPMQFEADSQPFVMDGRTFLPVRAIAEAADMTVDFDGNTNTVFLGSRTPTYTPTPQPTPAPTPQPTPQPASIYLFDNYRPFLVDNVWLYYFNTDAGTIVSRGGWRYTDTSDLQMTTVGVGYTKGMNLVVDSSKTASVRSNIGGKYSRVTGLIGFDDANSERVDSAYQIRVFADDRLLETKKTRGRFIRLAAAVCVPRGQSAS